VQPLSVVAHRQVAVQRHRVDVAGNHDPLPETEVGASHQRVADPSHVEMGNPDERLLDGVGECLLVPAHRLDVDHRLGQGHHIRAEVQRHVGHLVTRLHGAGSRASCMRMPERLTPVEEGAWHFAG
jgi:hypothetical protein